jgi:hypothetical protein
MGSVPFNIFTNILLKGRQQEMILVIDLICHVLLDLYSNVYYILLSDSYGAFEAPNNCVYSLSS